MHSVLAVIPYLFLAGCGQTSSPSQFLFGAYFPYWLICVGAGLCGAAVLRLVFIKIGLDELLPWRVVVYAALAALIGFALALSVYGR